MICVWYDFPQTVLITSSKFFKSHILATSDKSRIYEYADIYFLFQKFICSRGALPFLTVGLGTHGYTSAITLRGEACRGPLCCRSQSEMRERLGCESNKEEKTWTDCASFRHFCLSLMNKPFQIQWLTVASMESSWPGGLRGSFI